MSEVVAFTLVVPGDPRGYGRTRINMVKGRPVNFMPTADRVYRQGITLAWQQAGSPQLTAGYWMASVEAFMARPKGHYRKDGELSAAGLRTPYPTRTPDVDNVLKNVDALVKCGAVPDDRLMVEGIASKHWAQPGEERLVFRVRTIGAGPDSLEESP